MAPSTHATLVIVPGSFSFSHVYDPLVDPLRSKGYDIHVLDPPAYPQGEIEWQKKYGSEATKPQPPTMYDDAKFTANAIKQLVEEGKDVVVMGHSYGGLPASESVKGLTKRERSAQGKSGGVVRLAYMTALVPPVGKSLAETNVGSGPMSIEVGDDGWMTHSDPETTGLTVFSSLSREDAIEKAKQFGRHSGASFMTPLTHPGYKDVPVSYFFCELDQCVIPDVQTAGITVIEDSWYAEGGRFEGQEKGKKVDVTRVKADHVPVFSTPQESIDWVESIILKAGSE